MKFLLALIPLSALPLTLFPASVDPAAAQTDAPAPEAAPDAAFAEAMQKAAKLTSPGERHALLERFVGEWETSSSVFFGGQSGGAAPGTAEFHWKVPGRWIEGSFQGAMMGMSFETHSWLGYDNFKQSYVWTGISSADTAMNHAEGDLTQHGSSLLLYGTLDEYLTGEHDKMVKYAWRFLSDDEMVLEVHDLPIGEVNTKVVEFRYRRKDAGK
ncbi:MAG: DUF1579 family protein [Planctomycetota bacterium]